MELEYALDQRDFTIDQLTGQHEGQIELARSPRELNRHWPLGEQRYGQLLANSESNTKVHSSFHLLRFLQFYFLCYHHGLTWYSCSMSPWKWLVCEVGVDQFVQKWSAVSSNCFSRITFLVSRLNLGMFFNIESSYRYIKRHTPIWRCPCSARIWNSPRCSAMMLTIESNIM